MKTKEELNTLKKEITTLNEKLSELNEKELEQVIGGIMPVLLGFVSPIIKPQPNWNAGELPKDAGNYQIKKDTPSPSQWSPSADHTSLS